MSRLALRRGTVLSVERPGPATELTVEVAGERRPAISYTEMTGPVEPGDDVVVNVAARDLDLGSGGFDVVHVNLTRGLDGTGIEGAHVMKLNYTSLQHAVKPVEEVNGDVLMPGVKPVAVIALHAQLPCVAWAAAQDNPGARIGYVQTGGGALPGDLSRVVRELRERELLAGHITAGPAFGGEHDAITTAGALHAGLHQLGWDAAIAGPGPGIIGSGTHFGHGGMAALDTAHAALTLACKVIVVPRMSSGDPRDRHRDVSHHSRTVLALLLRPVIVSAPVGVSERWFAKHDLREADPDLAGYAASGLPARTMGRSIEQDELFFKAALAGGTVLAEEITQA